MAVGALVTVAEPGTGRALFDGYTRGLLAFSATQATLSTILSIGFAVPLARAIARQRRFPGRGMLVRLIGLPLVVPVLVGVLGILAVAGRNGWLAQALEPIAPGAWPSIYGMTGILLAHVFFNLPLATRVLLTAWAAVPAENWRLVGQLGLTGGAVFRLIEWPLLRRTLPPVASLIFLLCFTSFAIVLTLGGGPPNATLEVAIYQALRFDFDLARAGGLGAIQIALALVVMAVALAAARRMPLGDSLDIAVARPDHADKSVRAQDAAIILTASLFLALPLAAVLLRAATGPLGPVLGDPDVWTAAARSVGVAVASAALALMLGLSLVLTARSLRLRWYRPAWAGAAEVAGSVTLVIPPLAIGAGWFVAMRGAVDPFDLALPATVAANALFGLPFVIRLLSAPADRAVERYGRLADSLGFGIRDRLRHVEGPLLRRPVGTAAGLVAALSVGDLGVITLFGSPGTTTLPLELYNRLGAYRSDEAPVVAGLLVATAAACFIGLERAIGGQSRRPEDTA